MNAKKRKEFVLITCLGIMEVCKNKNGEIRLKDILGVIILIIDVFFDYFSEAEKIEKSELYKKLARFTVQTFLEEEENEA